MIRWAEPVYLWFLLAVPVALAGVVIAAILARRRLRRSIDRRLVPSLTEQHSPALALIRDILLALALVFLLIAAARPKWGEKLQLYRGRGIDIVFALDASNSMRAEDVKPNRLTRAKAELAALMGGLSGNAVGIVAFAGDAFVMCPMTTDLDAARMFLDIVSPEMMPVQGTDFGRAIDVAMSLFNPDEKNYKALVLVTDGDDMGRNTPQAVQRAVDAGIRIFPVAFATIEGAPIPEYDEHGNLRAYKKEKDGSTAISRMNERQLVLIARTTEGRFMRVEGFSADRLLAALDAMRKKDIGGGSFTDYVERYQMFLIIALVLFLGSMLITDRKDLLRRFFARADRARLHKNANR